MQDTQYLSVAGNRTAIRSISRQVLADLAPDEVEASALLIDPLIDMTAAGEAVTVDASDEPGGFGGNDLLALVVVPVVVTVVGDLLVELGEVGIDQLKEKLKRKKDPKAFIEIKLEDLELTVSRVKPPGSKVNIKRLAEALNRALLEYLIS